MAVSLSLFKIATWSAGDETFYSPGERWFRINKKQWRKDPGKQILEHARTYLAKWLNEEIAESSLVSAVVVTTDGRFALEPQGRIQAQLAHALIETLVRPSASIFCRCPNPNCAIGTYRKTRRDKTNCGRAACKKWVQRND